MAVQYKKQPDGKIKVTDDVSIKTETIVSLKTLREQKKSLEDRLKYINGLIAEAVKLGASEAV
jgi:hypothetical protein